MSDQLHEDRFKMGLTRPFADRFNRFVENSGGAVEPLQGRMDPNEYKTVYNSLTQSDPELAAEMGNVHESPFIRGNAAMVHYPVNDQWAMKNASRYGLRLRPGFNNIVEPTGLRHKNRPTDFSTMSSDQIRNHLMEIIEGAVQPDIDDDRNPEALSLDAPLLANQSPTPQIDPTAFRDPDKARSSWDEAVDWWLSHNFFDEDVPSGGGLMVGPQEMAKLGNFLKDALLPLMAGDVGLAGVGGLGPFDPVPVPFGKVIGEGVKGAKAGVRAVRGAVRGGDEAVEAAARGTWSVDYPEAELVPIEFFDDMPSVNMEVERAGDVDTDLFSYKTTSEDLERLGSLAERADLGPGEFRVFATEVLGGADELELENFGALMADMETRGLDNPLVVDFDPDTGGVILGEGNHRLAAARELGWDVVPVSVRRSSVAAELALDTEKLLPPLEQLGDLPQTISPSQVGMPTAGGVARETGEAVARTDAGPWTQKLLDVDAQRQAGIDAGRPRSIQALSETIDVTGTQPHGEIIIHYNHPRYSAHGERTATITWGLKMDPTQPSSLRLDFVQSMPLERRVRWSMPVLRKVKQVIDEMTAEGITIVAEVALDRPDLLRLYERAGFVRVPQELMSHQGGREGMVEMVRRPVTAG